MNNTLTPFNSVPDTSLTEVERTIGKTTTTTPQPMLSFDFGTNTILPTLLPTKQESELTSSRELIEIRQAQRRVQFELDLIEFNKEKALFEVSKAAFQSQQQNTLDKLHLKEERMNYAFKQHNDELIRDRMLFEQYKKMWEEQHKFQMMQSLSLIPLPRRHLNSSSSPSSQSSSPSSQSSSSPSSQSSSSSPSSQSSSLLQSQSNQIAAVTPVSTPSVARLSSDWLVKSAGATLSPLEMEFVMNQASWKNIPPSTTQILIQIKINGESYPMKRDLRFVGSLKSTFIHHLVEQSSDCTLSVIQKDSGKTAIFFSSPDIMGGAKVQFRGNHMAKQDVVNKAVFGQRFTYPFEALFHYPSKKLYCESCKTESTGCIDIQHQSSHLPFFEIDIHW